MKKGVLVLIAVGLCISGCAKKAVTPVEQTKPIPVEKVTSLDTDDKAEKSSRALKEQQAKLKDINFDFDKFEIRKDAKPALKELADVLAKNKNLKVMIEGHCDSRGTNEYNLALGERRANATKKYLVSIGVPANRIETMSYGEEKPLCTLNAKSCHAKNRRSHFVLREV